VFGKFKRLITDMMKGNKQGNKNSNKQLLGLA